MVNAWGFDVPLLGELSQSSARARLPSLHHLIILCGGETAEWERRDYETLFHSSSTYIHLSLINMEFLFLWKNTNTFRKIITSFPFSPNCLTATFLFEFLFFFFIFIICSSQHVFQSRLKLILFRLKTAVEGRRRHRGWIPLPGHNNGSVKQQNTSSMQTGSPLQKEA